MVEVVFEVVRTAFEEDEAVLYSVGHDIRSCAAEKLLKLVNWAGDDIVVVCGLHLNSKVCRPDTTLWSSVGGSCVSLKCARDLDTTCVSCAGIEIE